MEQDTNERLTDANERISYMTDLQKLVNKLDKDGFTDQFTVREGKLICLTIDTEYSPEAVKAVNFYRFEGPSNPDDMEICYVIETDDGRKGTLIDAYGIYSDDETSEFMQKVEIFKKTKRERDHTSDPHEGNNALPKDVLNVAIDPESFHDPLQVQKAKEE